MSPGSYISFALHLGFVGWLVLNGDFSRKPSEMSVADVSVVSSEVFDVMINNISPEISAEVPSAEAIPVEEAAEGPSAPEVDAAPAQLAQSLSQISSGDALPSRRPEPVVPVQDVVILPPVELQTPLLDDSAQTPLQTSLPPKPRPAQRIAPAAINAPDMEMDLGAQSREAAAPQEAPAEVAQEQEAQAPVLDAMIAAIIGYIDHAVDTVSASLLGGSSQISEAVRRRRVEASPSDTFVEQLLGLRLTRQQVERGHAFAAGVVERAGQDGLAALFAAAGNLPTPNELDAPGLWLARLNIEQRDISE